MASAALASATLFGNFRYQAAGSGLGSERAEIFDDSLPRDRVAPVAQLAQLRLFDELGRAKEQKLLGPTPEDRRYHLNGPVEIGELLLSASTAESNHACCCAEIASQHSRSSGVFRQLTRRRNVRRWHSSGLCCTAAAHQLSRDELTVSGHGCDRRTECLLNSSTLFAGKAAVQVSAETRAG
jgi:hypothetical protein